MTKKKALIMVKLGIPSEKEAEWNNWYDTEHIPDRLVIPGFNSARRFTAVEGKSGNVIKDFIIEGDPKYLSLYDLENIDVINSKPYGKLREKELGLNANAFVKVTETLPKFSRGVYEQIYPEQGDYKPPHTRFVFVVGHEVPRNRHQEFNAWYNTEHIPRVLSVPGFVTARRFIHAENKIPPMGIGESLPKYLTVYDVESVAAFESDALLKVSISPWSTWVRSWFTRKMCMLYQRIYPEDL